MPSFAALVLLTPFLPSAPNASADASAIAADISAALQTIEERRRLDVVEPEENTFMFDGPGLTLTFAVRLPDGRTLLEIAQPTQLTATDSTGTDLAAIEPDFMGDKTYIEIEQMWGEPPTSFTFTLALPTRSAATFDLSADLSATTFGSLATIDIPVTSEWKQLDAAQFSGTPVSVRLTEQDGSPHVEVKPGTVRSHIEEIQLVSGGEILESGMSMWNDSMLTYMFDGEPADAMTLKLTLRRDLEEVGIAIRLDDQDLP